MAGPNTHVGTFIHLQGLTFDQTDHLTHDGVALERVRALSAELEPHLPTPARMVR